MNNRIMNSTCNESNVNMTVIAICLINIIMCLIANSIITHNNPFIRHNNYDIGLVLIVIGVVVIFAYREIKYSSKYTNNVKDNLMIYYGNWKNILINAVPIILTSAIQLNQKIISESESESLNHMAYQILNMLPANTVFGKDISEIHFNSENIAEMTTVSTPFVR